LRRARLRRRRYCKLPVHHPPACGGSVHAPVPSTTAPNTRHGHLLPRQLLSPHGARRGGLPVQVPQRVSVGLRPGGRLLLPLSGGVRLSFSLSFIHISS
jgi:hypothetical protein